MSGDTMDYKNRRIVGLVAVATGLAAILGGCASTPTVRSRAYFPPTLRSNSNQGYHHSLSNVILAQKRFQPEENKNIANKAQRWNRGYGPPLEALMKHDLSRLSRVEKVVVARAMNNYGWALGSQNRYRKAISVFSKAISLDGRRGDIFFNRAMMYFRSDELEEADEDLGQAQDLDPNNEKVQRLREIIRSKKQGHTK